jgi:arylsulfatase A-like enzyme
MSNVEPGFTGRIGTTLADSTPAWPELPAGLGGPNVVMIVLDDTGFAHIGAYGSTLETPVMDRLANEGLQYTGFHTTALCSPTRACLLTGRNHHSVGMRGVSNWNTGFPHMRGGIAPSAATVAELLRDHGYATFAAGKWHLAPMEECSAAGPHTNWPLQKGFDKFYGFMNGETDQFSPELTRDNHHIDAPRTAQEGYHVSEDIVDESRRWISDLTSVRPDRPFFLYLSFGAMHAPHQAPQEYLDRWKGRFDEGYEVWRERWFERQVRSGVVPEGTTLAPLNPGVPRWDDLTANQKAFSCRLQEAFAAMLEHTDHQIGRLVETLEARGILDDTVVMVLSDNGASREGGPYGVMDEWSFFNAMWEDIDEIAQNRLDDIGGPHSHSNYPWGWAQAGNTPLRWFKQNTYGGGVRDPLIVHWPTGIGTLPEDDDHLRRQFCHAIDLVPTILDIVGLEAPTTFAGREQQPMHGASIVPTFTDPGAPNPRHVQYFEQMGHRGIWHDGWKATTYHEAGASFDDDVWGLYRLDDDFSECHDLSDEHPDVLADMVALWWQQADEMGVLPLDDRTIELFFATPRPGTVHGRSRYVYVPPMSHLPSDASPPLGTRPWTITADVTVGDDPVEGVLYARGSHNVGHSFFVKDSMLHFDYNALGTHHRASGPITLSPGRHRLVARFERVEKAGRMVVSADGVDVGSVEVPRLVRILGSTGTDIGCDRGSTVVSDYVAPFAFTGELHSVVFDIHSRRSQSDVEAQALSELARE